METLKRQPELSVLKEFELPDGTKIAVRKVTARTLVQVTNAKNLSDTERGLRILAAKILVNGQPIVYDDLLDGFTDDELTQIAEAVSGEDGEKNG